MLRQILLGAAGGLLGATLIGLCEALLVLSTVSIATEYGALFYAAVIYAAVGAALGLIPGLLLALAGARGRGISPPMTYTLSFLSVTCGLGALITRQLVDRYLYLGLGISSTGAQLIVVGAVLLGLIILWLGPIFLTRTPFKIVLKPRGTFALFGAIVLLSAVFSFAPSRESRYGTLEPEQSVDSPVGGPNVLLILVSSLRADHVSEENTPNLMALGRDGLVFERAYASAAWIRPSAASLLTSMEPRSHGAVLPISALPDEVDTLAEILGSAGYVTGGLPNSAWLTRAANFQQGYDYYRFLAPEYALDASESASRLALYRVARSARAWISGGRRRVEQSYAPAEEALGYAREFVDARADGRPWFLFVHLADPRPPWFDHTDEGRALDLPPTGAPAGEARVAYDRELRWMDGQLGDFLEWLKRSGGYEHTAIVVTADHGLELGERGHFGAGDSLYDEVIHIPLLIKLPGQRLAGERVPWQVRQIDVAPTLTTLVGQRGSPLWQGRDLLNTNQGPAEAHPMDRPVLAETIAHGTMLSALRFGGWKLIRANTGNPRGLRPAELYHLKSDPGERSDLASREPNRQAALDKLLVEQISEAASVSVQRAIAELDEATRARLEALGYME